MPSAAPPAFILFGDLPKIGPFLADLTSRGLAVLLVTGPPRSSLERRAAEFLDAPGHPFAAVTEVRVLRGEDRVGILDQVAEWSRRYAVVGVLAAAEVFVEPAALATDLLGLPGVGLRAARVCRNKFLQRLYLARWSPASELVTERTRASVVERFAGRFPVVVKPLELWSSIGVRAFDDGDELAAHLADLDPGTEVLVEERVRGPEFNVDAIVVDDECAFTAVTQKGTNEGSTRFFAELTHTTPPANLDAAGARLLGDTHAAVVRRLGFGTGMAHAEYRLTPGGEVVLMEIAARPPGDGCLHLHHLATGRPVEPALVEVALGGRVDHPEPVRRARQTYFEHEPGELRDVAVRSAGDGPPAWVVDTGCWPPLEPVAADAPAGLRAVLVLKERGERLRPITESGDRAVTAIFDAPLDADVDALEAEVRGAITIDTARPDRADG